MAAYDLTDQVTDYAPSQDRFVREDVELMSDEDLEDFRQDLIVAIETIDRDLEVENTVPLPDRTWMARATTARRYKSRQLRWVLSELSKRGLFTTEATPDSAPEREIISAEVRASLALAKQQIHHVEAERNKLKNDLQVSSRRVEALLRKVASLTSHINAMAQRDVNRKKAEQRGEVPKFHQFFVSIAREELPDEMFQRMFIRAVERENHDAD